MAYRLAFLVSARHPRKLPEDGPVTLTIVMRVDSVALLWGCSQESRRNSVTKKPPGKAYGWLRAFLHYLLVFQGMVCTDFTILS
jgi:hypothetical protein